MNQEECWKIQTNKGTENILQGKNAVKFTKSLWLRWYGHVEKNAKPKKCQNILQQLQSKEQGKEADDINDGEMKLKRAKI
jgi:hypothetical protein